MASSTTGPMIPHNSNNKRVFPGSGSSDNGPLNYKMLKLNEGVSIGDTKEVDLDDDSESDDEYTALQSVFDNIDVPAGVEVSFPQVLSDIKVKRKMKGHRTQLANSLRLHMAKMKKVRSVRRLAYTWHQKVSSGSVKSSTINWDDRFEHLINHGKNIAVKDETVVKNTDNNVEVIMKYKNFKRFDIVEDFSDHHYAGSGSSTMEPPRNWAKKIQEEWKILEKNLPDMIYVRVYESRMDLLRAVIVGAEGTPYHDGLFFFDVCFPQNYPNEPPQVHYHSGGLRINPNLYHNGKVCLSLLNTWMGRHENERWTPGVSTMFQVLLSIQALILNENPYWNEPVVERRRGSIEGENKSLRYNERTLVYSLRTMVYTMKKPPKHFEDLVVGYFSDHARGILTTCKGYIKGNRVGCAVDDGDEKASREFRNDVKDFMKTLVGAFNQIGVQNLEEFVPPTQNLSQKIKAFFGI